MQSVDVLRGPQGTLFGKNVTGGAVVFRPNKPTDTWDSYIEGETGDYKRAYFEGMINAPVNDWLQIRAAGNLLDRNGFVTNLTPEPGIREELNNAHYRSARLTIRTLFGPVTNDIIGTYYGENDSGPVEVGIEYLPPVEALGAKTYGPWTVSLGGNASGVTLPIYQRIKVSGFEDALNWQIADGISLHNALSLNDTYADTFQNNDGTFIYMVDGRTESRYRQWIEEPTIHISLLDGKLRYTGGLWYSHNTQLDGNSYNLAQNYLYGLPPNTLYPGQPPSPVAQLLNSYYRRNGYSRAIYSQADFDVKPDVTVTMGLRYNWDELSLNNSQHFGQAVAPDPTGNFFAGACNAGILQYYSDFNPTTCTAIAQRHFSSPSGNFGITDHLTDKSILYFKIAYGYQAGGLNNQIREQAYQGFLPEKTTEFESGYKADWTLAGRPIRTNIDGFYGHARDKQEVENGQYADGGQWIAVFNAGALTYYGGDLSIEWLATDWLKLSYDWTRIWTNYDNFVFPAIGLIPQTNLTGNRPAQIPANTINGDVTLYWPVPQEVGKIATSVTAFHRSSITFADVVNLSGPLGTLNSSDAYGQAFTVMNFSTYWNNMFSSHLTGGVWVRNLQNKLYRVSAGPQAGLGYAVVNYADPRTYGVNLRYNFK